MNLPDYIDFNHPRLARYSKNKLLFQGEAWQIFGISDLEYFKFIDPSNAEQQYIAFDFPRIITNTIAELIWAEPPSFSFKTKENQDWFDLWRIEQNLDTTCFQLTQTASHAGDGVVKLAVDYVHEGSDKFDVCLYEVSPNCWFPDYYPHNPSKQAKNHTIYTQKKISDTKTAMLLEIHSYGQITYECYINESQNYKKVSPMDYFPEFLNMVLIDEKKTEEGVYSYKTETSSPLIFHISNYKTSGEYFGESDYTTPIISKLYAINQNYNQIQDVLKKHANPKMQVPASIIQNAILQAQENNRRAKVWGYENVESFKNALQNDEESVRYEIAARIVRKMEFFAPGKGDTTDTKFITWDGNLAESREQIKSLKEAVALEAQIAQVLISPDTSFGNISGIGIQRLAQTSINKAKRKIAYLSSVLKHIIFTAQELAIKTQGIETSLVNPEYPTIKFKDGLVNDVMDIIQKNQLLLDNELTTQIDALADIFEYTKQEAEEKYLEITKANQEKTKSLLNATSIIPTNK